MDTRKLGASDLTVSPIGLGCMGFSHAYGKATDKSDAVRTIRKAYEMGYTFFDTAEVYTGITADGQLSYNEELVGEALKNVRDKVVIATKFGVSRQDDNTILADSRPEVIRRSVEQSLNRLGTDHIDLYYQHRMDKNIPPEEVAGVVGELIREGKVRYWGISEVNEEYLRRAHSVTPVTAIQNRYSMAARWHESLFPVLEELNIAFVAFSPLANGLLSGKYEKAVFTESGDYRAAMPQYTEEGRQKYSELLKLLERLAAEKSATTSQIALAWALCKKPYIVPIPGSRRLDRLSENLHSADILLTESEVAELDRRLDEMTLPIFGGNTVK